MIDVPHVDFWQNVVTNLAAIIASFTALCATLGGLYIQNKSTKKQFREQNQKIDQNTYTASTERATLGRKVDEVHSATNGIVQRNEQLAKALGISEGRAQEKSENANGPPQP